jgi:2,4-dienoyl-CoA reductase-like NADH-dependent reductase (Old Yellow Enzyme family)
MPELLSPLVFSGLALRNRIVMPPMWSGQAGEDGQVTDVIVEYHRKRAAGCGLVIVEHSFVHPLGRHSPTQLGSYSDHLVEGLRRLTTAVKAEGAVVALQLSHAGSRGRSAFLGRLPVAPSAVRHPYEPGGEIPEEVALAAIGEIVQAFGAAAGRARDAGFDAVELHAAHGFLLSEFLSPLTNLRTDGYGGPLANRARLHLEALREVQRATGSAFPVFVRLGACDETPGGLTLEDACGAAAMLVGEGAALIDVSGGLQGSRPSGRGPGYFVEYAEAIRSRVSVPVMVTGGIRDPELADVIVRRGQADLVGIGRAMLEDPDWAIKAAEQLSGF